MICEGRGDYGFRRVKSGVEKKGGEKKGGEKKGERVIEMLTPLGVLVGVEIEVWVFCVDDTTGYSAFGD